MSAYEIIYGINPVQEALRSGRRSCHEICVADNIKRATIERLEGLAREKRVRIKRLKKEELCRRAGTGSHQGVCASVDPFPYATLEDVLATSLSDERKSFLVILDGITDPQNMGSIIRTAHLLGAHGVIVPKDNSCPITATVVKVSAGATEYLPVARVVNIANTINYLKDKGIWVAATDSDADKSLYDNEFAGYHYAIVLGAEGKGIRRLVRERCDILLNIPMEGKIDSFNVSVAAAIMMGEISRQRRKK